MRRPRFAQRSSFWLSLGLGLMLGGLGGAALATLTGFMEWTSFVRDPRELLAAGLGAFTAFAAGGALGLMLASSQERARREAEGRAPRLEPGEELLAWAPIARNRWEEEFSSGGRPTLPEDSTLWGSLWISDKRVVLLYDGWRGIHRVEREACQEAAPLEAWEFASEVRWGAPFHRLRLRLRGPQGLRVLDVRGDGRALSAAVDWIQVERAEGRLERRS